MTGLANSWVRRSTAFERVHRGIDLHRWSEQRVVADPDRTHVEDYAIEVEEDAAAKEDVRAVVAVERRLHPHLIASGPEQIDQDPAPLLLVGLACRVQRLAQVARLYARRRQLWIERIVQLPRPTSCRAQSASFLRSSRRAESSFYNWFQNPCQGGSCPRTAPLGARAEKPGHGRRPCAPRGAPRSRSPAIGF